MLKIPNLFKYLNPYVFLASLAFGVFAVYIFSSERVIYVYPTPENVDLLLFRDKTDNCFQFRKQEVDCGDENGGGGGGGGVFSVPAQS